METRFNEGRISREAHKNQIIETIRTEMKKPSVHCRPYRRLLNLMANRTIEGGHHRLITTNWDFLLQLEVDAWIRANQPGYAPRFLSTNSFVLHLNGTVEPGESPNRSPFLLETDDANYRKQSYEANKAFNFLLWSTIVVIIGMSFECKADNGLLAALQANKDYVPIGVTLFVIVDPSKETLDKVGGKLYQCFPRSRQQHVNT